MFSKQWALPSIFIKDTVPTLQHGETKAKLKLAKRIRRARSCITITMAHACRKHDETTWPTWKETCIAMRPDPKTQQKWKELPPLSTEHGNLTMTARNSFTDHRLDQHHPFFKSSSFLSLLYDRRGVNKMARIKDYRCRINKEFMAKACQIVQHTAATPLMSKFHRSSISQTRIQHQLDSFETPEHPTQFVIWIWEVSNYTWDDSLSSSIGKRASKLARSPCIDRSHRQFQVARRFYFHLFAFFFLRFLFCCCFVH